MTFYTVISLACIALLAGAGLLLVMTSDLVRALLLFFIVLLGTAAAFILGGADFLAIAQIILYAGGILVVMLFGVMLTHKARGVSPKSGWNFFLPAALATIFLFALICRTALQWIEKNNLFDAAPDFRATASDIGIKITGEWVLPFELLSVLLLLAMIGASALARNINEEEES